MAWSKARRAKFQATLAAKKTRKQMEGRRLNASVTGKRAAAAAVVPLREQIRNGHAIAMQQQAAVVRKMTFAVKIETEVSLDLVPGVSMTGLDIHKLILSTLARREDVDVRYALIDIK